MYITCVHWGLASIPSRKSGSVLGIRGEKILYLSGKVSEAACGEVHIKRMEKALKIFQEG